MREGFGGGRGRVQLATEGKEKGREREKTIVPAYAAEGVGTGQRDWPQQLVNGPNGLIRDKWGRREGKQKKFDGDHDQRSIYLVR